LGSHDRPVAEAAAARTSPAVPSHDEGSLLPIPEVQFKPPWHVRHARAILSGVALACAAGLAYGGYALWRLSSDPLEKLISERGRPLQPAAAAGTIVPPRPAEPAPAARVAAPPPRPAIAKAMPLAQPAATLAAPAGPAHRPVTHTQPAEPAPAAAQASAAARACGEAVAALGLCAVEGKGDRQ